MSFSRDSAHSLPFPMSDSYAITGRVMRHYRNPNRDPFYYIKENVNSCRPLVSFSFFNSFFLIAPSYLNCSSSCCLCLSCWHSFFKYVLHVFVCVCTSKNRSEDTLQKLLLSQPCGVQGSRSGGQVWWQEPYLLSQLTGPHFVTDIGSHYVAQSGLQLETHVPVSGSRHMCHSI